jgi:hypothetical protein
MLLMLKVAIFTGPASVKDLFWHLEQATLTAKIATDNVT